MSRFNSGNSSKQELNRLPLNKTNLKRAGFIFKYLLPYRFRFIAALVLLSLGSLLSLAFPYLFGELIDLAGGKSSEYFPGGIHQLLLTVGIILILSAVMSFFRIMWFAETGEKALADLRSDLFAHVVRLPKSFFDFTYSGELMSRMNNDLSQIQDTLSTFLANVIRQSIILIAGVSIVLFTHTRLALLMLAMIPLVVVFALMFGRTIRKLARTAQNEMAEANIIAEESFSGLVQVKTNTQEDIESGRYRKALQVVVQTAIKNSRYRGAFAASVVFLMFGAIIGVMWYGTYLIQLGELTIGDLNSFIFYGMFIAGSMAGFAENYNQLQKTLGATERIVEMFHEKAEHGGTTNATGISGHIGFSKVTFSYPSRPEVQVLKEISFNVSHGQKLALVGASGSGKSTIASLLLRLYPVDSGEITLDGTPIEFYHLKELREQMAYVPQDVMLFAGTIAENIAYGKPGSGDAEIREAARQANALDFITQFPDGMQTIVGERGMQLSGGQRQRIAIARAFLRNPRILILDEATSALDVTSEAQVQLALDRIMQGRTCIIIAHRLSTIRLADQILVIKDGCVVEQGTHEELKSLPDGEYHKLLSIQAKAE